MGAIQNFLTQLKVGGLHSCKVESLMVQRGAVVILGRYTNWDGESEVINLRFTAEALANHPVGSTAWAWVDYATRTGYVTK